MKSKILLLALTVAALSSCTTSYKTGQTPDDVYYSPVRSQDEYVRTEKNDDRQYRNNEDEYYDDNYLRMKVRNRNRQIWMTPFITAAVILSTTMAITVLVIHGHLPLTGTIITIPITTVISL